MKKLLALAVAVLLMAAFTVTAFAEISPTAPVVTTTTAATTVPSGANNSPTAPQTGSTLLIPVIAFAAAGVAGIAAKKLSDKN